MGIKPLGVGGFFRGNQQNGEAGGYMKRSDHYLDWHTNTFVCAHCGKREPVHPYSEIREVKKKMEKFKQEHKECKPESKQENK